MDSQLIQSVLAATDKKRIVGRIRLQKIFYLMEQLGLESGLKFSYHHYGPYSEELSKSVQSACIVDKLIEEKVGYTQYGNPFSTYSLLNETEKKCVGKIPKDEATKFLEKMLQRTSVEIEIAATIHWIFQKENLDDWRSELEARKASKANEANINAAIRLLDELGLAPT